MPAFESRPVTTPANPAAVPALRRTNHPGMSFAEEYLKRCAERRQEPYYPWVAGAKDRVLDVDCEFMTEEAWTLVLSALRTSTVGDYHRLRLACFENMGPRHPPKQSRRLVAYEALAAIRAPRLPPMLIASKLVSGLSHQVMLSALTLRELRLCGIPIGPEGAARLATAMALATSLRDVQLDGSGIGNVGLAELVPVLKRLPELTTVSLRRCGLTCAAADDLGRLAAGTTSSKHWEQTLRSDDPTKQTARRGIASLALADNSVGDIVVGKLFREEACRSHLKWLDLSGSAVSADAGQLLLRMVASPAADSALGFVDLSNTPAASFFVAGSGNAQMVDGVHIVVAGSGFNRCQLLRTHGTAPPAASAPSGSKRTSTQSRFAAPERTRQMQQPLPLDSRQWAYLGEDDGQGLASQQQQQVPRSGASSRSPSALAGPGRSAQERQQQRPKTALEAARGGRATVEDELFLMVDSPANPPLAALPRQQHQQRDGTNSSGRLDGRQPSPVSFAPTPTAFLTRNGAVAEPTTMPAPSMVGNEVGQLLEAYGRRIRELEGVVSGYAALLGGGGQDTMMLPPSATLPSFPDPRKFAAAIARSRPSPLAGVASTANSRSPSQGGAGKGTAAGAAAEPLPASLDDLASDEHAAPPDGEQRDESTSPSQPGGEIATSLDALAKDRKHLDPVLAPGDVAAAVHEEVKHALEESEAQRDDTVTTMARYVMEAMESMQAHTAEANARLEAKLIDQSLALSKLQRQLEEERHLRDDAQSALAMHFKEETRKAAAKGSTRIVVVPATDELVSDSIGYRSKKTLETCIDVVLDNLKATLGVPADAKPAKADASKEQTTGVPPSSEWRDAPPKPISAQVRSAAREADVAHLTSIEKDNVKNVLKGLNW